MSQEPPRILAINPGTRYVGFAAFRGPELLDWGVRVITAKTPRGKVKAAGAILVEAIERYGSDTLVIKRLHRSRSSACLDGLSRSIRQLARPRKLQLREYSIAQVIAALCPQESVNKRQLAEHVTAIYAVLAHDFKRELANRNPYYLRMFEAVALGAVCWDRMEEQLQTH
jgi:Holliday junction resolvasome RuvABC endonuclease subunit